MRVHPIFPSFTTGEISPLMYGRVDFAKFTSGLRTLLNYIIRPHGPVFRRPGTHFVAEVKDSTKFTRLLKFEYSTQQAYQIEAGDQYFRFYKDGGRINLGNNKAITGLADNGAGLIRVTCVGHGLTTGQGVDITAVVATGNLDLVVNRSWPQVTVINANTYDLVGSAFTGVYTSGGLSNGSIDVVTPYLSADLPTLKYVQKADTVYFTHPSYPVQKLTRNSHTSWTFSAVNFLPPATEELGTVAASSYDYGSLTLGATSGLGVAFTFGLALALAGDVGRLISTPDGGRAIIATVATPTTGTVDIVTTFGATFYASGGYTIQGSPNTSLTPSASQPAHSKATLTLAANGWHSSDVGRYVRVNGGVVRIISVSSATAATGEILTPLINVTASPGGSWSLEDPEWTATRGYPRALGFHEQRLVFGGSAAKPTALWGSVPGSHEVIALGPDDDDAYEFLMATNDVNTINWIVPTRALLVGTASSEFAIQGSTGATNAAISPNNVDIKASTFWGSSEKIQPLRIGNAALFLSRSGTELREMVFSLQRDSYIADDMLLLSEHLTKGTVNTITDIAYQRHPNSLVWSVRSDGTLLGLTYQREHDVVGWSRHITGPDGQETTPVKGKFEAVITTPHWQGDRDVSFFVVKRIINGATKRLVEYMDDVNGYYGGLGMDSALLYSGASTTVLTGLTHLAGETVQILGDGAVYPEAVVSSVGAVILDGLPASRIEIGLGFGSKLETMTVEVPQQGTSQGRQKHWAEIIVRLHSTIGLFVQGEEKPFRSAQDDMDNAVPLFSGDMKHKGTGRSTDGVITVEQRQPLPQTVCAIFGTLQVGE
jgi:hypothetical protein